MAFYEIRRVSHGVNCPEVVTPEQCEVEKVQITSEQAARIILDKTFSNVSEDDKRDLIQEIAPAIPSDHPSFSGFLGVAFFHDKYHLGWQHFSIDPTYSAMCRGVLKEVLGIEHVPEGRRDKSLYELVYSVGDLLKHELSIT